MVVYRGIRHYFSCTWLILNLMDICLFQVFYYYKECCNKSTCVYFISIFWNSFLEVGLLGQKVNIHIYMKFC